MGLNRRKADRELAHDAVVAEARSRCSDPELLRWPSTAAEARRLGVNKFFNGVPCEPKGHIGLRRAKTSNCIQCEVERTLETARRKRREAQQQREEERQALWGGDCPWPATLREARRIGAEYYFTGVACARGHIQVRETTSNRCTDCPTPADIKRQRMKEEGLIHHLGTAELTTFPVEYKAISLELNQIVAVIGDKPNARECNRRQLKLNASVICYR